jgi:hypothetical protein
MPQIKINYFTNFEKEKIIFSQKNIIDSVLSFVSPKNINYARLEIISTNRCSSKQEIFWKRIKQDDSEKNRHAIVFQD